ncbi:mucin-2-like [Hetaerina americana]|uniref:mucin-2-like n=1 Tax=Hetaerina americana TaxID=62018 RepID=UPI003A7F4B30
MQFFIHECDLPVIESTEPTIGPNTSTEVTTQETEPQTVGPNESQTEVIAPTETDSPDTTYETQTDGAGSSYAPDIPNTTEQKFDESSTEIPNSIDTTSPYSSDVFRTFSSETTTQQMSTFESETSVLTEDINYSSVTTPIPIQEPVDTTTMDFKLTPEASTERDIYPTGENTLEPETTTSTELPETDVPYFPVSPESDSTTETSNGETDQTSSPEPPFTPESFPVMTTEEVVNVGTMPQETTTQSVTPAPSSDETTDPQLETTESIETSPKATTPPNEAKSSTWQSPVESVDEDSESPSSPDESTPDYTTQVSPDLEPEITPTSDYPVETDQETSSPLSTPSYSDVGSTTIDETLTSLAPTSQKDTQQTSASTEIDSIETTTESYDGSSSSPTEYPGDLDTTLNPTTDSTEFTDLGSMTTEDMSTPTESLEDSTTTMDSRFTTESTIGDGTTTPTQLPPRPRVEDADHVSESPGTPKAPQPCESDNDCLGSEACYGSLCQDPCEFAKACAPTAKCHTMAHRPVCTCPAGFEGNPAINCLLVTPCKKLIHGYNMS